MKACDDDLAEMMVRGRALLRSVSMSKTEAKSAFLQGGVVFGREFFQNAMETV